MELSEAIVASLLLSSLASSRFVSVFIVIPELCRTLRNNVAFQFSSFGSSIVIPIICETLRINVSSCSSSRSLRFQDCKFQLELSEAMNFTLLLQFQISQYSAGCCIAVFQCGNFYCDSKYLWVSQNSCFPLFCSSSRSSSFSVLQVPDYSHTYCHCIAAAMSSTLLVQFQISQVFKIVLSDLSQFYCNSRCLWSQ